MYIKNNNGSSTRSVTLNKGSIDVLLLESFSQLPVDIHISQPLILSSVDVGTIGEGRVPENLIPYDT
ncbi:unnamed protein product [Lactuca virosa]|uniref:Uncharacterized protein n=1 Tax=Lactuca virosa TaxID=75947 RepID=A0AAU9M2M2_9ASTR|nr:unnamed protein product [Lactuca virosa]